MNGRARAIPAGLPVEIIGVRTTGREEFVNVTEAVQAGLTALGARNGLCFLHCPHTTAGLTVNEGSDPAVVSDLLLALRKMVPEGGYAHAEGNSTAHVKSSLMGCSLALAVADGRLVLGTWQAVFFCEFDGPRSRHLRLSFLACGG
ncbi:MAG: secondary thiamine-phosphate synthase enzyme YjbQ [Candidatus Brocadiia bacterium]